MRTATNGKKAFHNQLIAAYTGWIDSRNQLKQAVVFADGSPLPDEVIMALDAFMTENKCAYKWSPGKFIIVDNSLVYHSREPFKGTRKIYACIGKGRKENTSTQSHIALPSGDRMPQIGFGCWKISADTCAEVVYQAIKAGYRLLDSAAAYGNEE